MICILVNEVFLVMFCYTLTQLSPIFSNHQQEAVAHLEEIKKSIEAKMALRQSNLNPDRPGLFIPLFFFNNNYGYVN